MAVTQTGSVLTLDLAGQNPTSQSISVPSDAQLAVFFWAGYADGLSLSTCTLGGQALTEKAEFASTALESGAGVAVLANPPTGTQTLTWTWSTTPAEGPIVMVAFYKGVDTSSGDGVRDGDADGWSGPSTEAVVLTTQSTDFVVGIAQSFTGTNPTTTGTTTVVDNHAFNSEIGDLATVNTVGGTTTNFEATGDYGSIAAIAIIPSAGFNGSQNATITAIGSQTATGSVAVNGAQAATIGGFTQTATGSVAVNGVQSATLGSFIQNATGTAAAGVNGVQNATITAIGAQTATGSVAVNGVQAATVGALSQTATGSVAISGAQSSTIGGFSQSATGTSGGVNGVQSATLGSFIQNARGFQGSLLLSVSSDSRYLVDSLGQPFFFAGDAGWSSYVQLAPGLTGFDLDTYLDTMQGLGVRVLLVNLFEHLNSDHPPENAVGIEPFTTPEDIRTLDDDYFDSADTFIEACADREIVVALCHAYSGFDGDNEGWYDAAIAPRTTGECTTFGAAIGSRLGHHPNIVWVQSGDYTPANQDRINAIMDGIRSAEFLRHLVTYHPAPNSSPRDVSGITTLDFSFEYWYVDDASTDGISSELAAAYGKSPTKPFFLGETFYENRGSGQQPGARWIRAQHIAAVLYGGGLGFPGDEERWHFSGTPDWEASLNNDLTQCYDAFVAAFASRPWYELEPDLNSDLITAGRGTLGAVAYVPAAINAAGTFAAAYTYAGASFTVDLSEFAGTVTARWCDPTTGALTAATGSPLANSGTHAFVASSEVGNNADGDPDWILLLEVLGGANGSQDATLGALSQSATGSVSVNGAQSSTLGALSQSAAGSVGVNGSQDATLGGFAQSATGSVAVNGAHAATIAAPTQTATGSVAISGSQNATLGAFTQDAEGAVGDSIHGAQDVTLGAISQTAAGSVAVDGVQSSTIGGFAQTATGTVAIAGSQSSTLALFVQTATGLTGILASDATGPVISYPELVIADPIVAYPTLEAL